jgi:hypothetical protein
MQSTNSKINSIDKMKNNSIIKILFLALLLPLLCVEQATAQQQSADFAFIGDHFGGEMLLKWAPVRPTLWDSLNTIGCNIERTELNELGTPKSGTTVLVASNILPRDSAWFNNHQDDYFGTMGMLLYDTTFQFENTELIDATQMRFDYLINEAQLEWHEPAYALGLAIQDSTMTDGLLYRYRLFAQHNGRTIAEETFDMESESGRFTSRRPIPTTAFNFNFHGGKSLIEMSGKLTENPVDQIFMNAKPMGDSIILRWAPNNAEFWERTLLGGFEISRIEMDENGLTDKRKEFDLVVAKTEEEIGRSVAGDSMAMVAVQVMYGQVPGAAEASIYDQGGLYQNRFGMALFAAENSAKAADVLGFRIVDREVVAGKKYTYFIKSPASNQPIHGDIIQVENTPVPDPVPVLFAAEAGDGAAILTWDKAANDINFSTYQLEKSTNGGKSWTKMNQRPLLILEDESIKITEYKYVDSSVVNYQKYNYRLSGYTSFAELGEPAEVEVTPVDLTPPPLPIITYGRLSEDKLQIDLEWGLDDATPDDLVGYHVLLNETFEGTGDTISQLLTPDNPKFTYIIPDTIDFYTHYFKIAAIDTAGNEVISFPHFIMVPDRSPPLPPPNIYGHVNDTTGIVTLVWDHSPSSDVTNYHVLFSNDTTAEFSVLTKVELLEDNIFYDTLSLKVLDEYVYYVVLAEDESYLRSEASNFLALKRPDYIPPIKAILQTIEAKEDALELTWSPSPSKDVVGYELFRREYGAEEWNLLEAIFDGKANTYLDNTAEINLLYEYTIRAKDDVDLYSEYAFPKKGKIPFAGDRMMVSNLQIVYDKNSKSLQLVWDFKEPEKVPEGVSNFEFYILKSIGGEEVEMYTEVTKGDYIFEDKEVEEGGLYNYAIMVVTNAGHMGGMSKIVSVQTE